MALTKTYTKSPCALDRMIQEIQNDTAITVALDLSATSLLGNQLTIGFRADLADWTEVDTLVTNHSGVPLPQNTATPVVVQTQPAVVIASLPPLATNSAGNGKAFYQRSVGLRQAVTVANPDPTVFTWTQSSFPLAQIYEVEVIGGEIGDYASFKVLDSATGLITGVPNYVLNQFAFTLNIAKDHYSHAAKFPATVPQGLQFQFIYYSVSAKTIGINLFFNEVK
jgi:hypothetical protein